MFTIAYVVVVILVESVNISSYLAVDSGSVIIASVEHGAALWFGHQICVCSPFIIAYLWYFGC